jgi:polysaccharide deacetylase 2 family uncharacterized protein YibQ
LKGWRTEVSNGGVRVALLIRGIGKDQRDSQEAIQKLPPAISLGFVPNSRGLAMANKARSLGHEIVLQLPLETKSSGSNLFGVNIFSAGTPEPNTEKISGTLNHFQGTGVTSVGGGKLLQSREALRPIMEHIKARNLVYIAEGTNSHAVVRQLAQELNIRYGNAAVIIDTHPTPNGVRAALDRLVAIAKKRGSAIGIGFASATTIEQIRSWSHELASKGVKLVPAATLAHTAGAS